MTVRRISVVVVVVPARNEELLIGRCLDALLIARGRLAVSRPAVRVRLMVVADTCDDTTVAIVESYADRGIELMSIRAGRVGAARATGIDRSLRKDSMRLSEVWIANTDADSVVPSEWLSCQVDIAIGGADVVIGMVRPDPADLTHEQYASWRASHPRGQANGHVHGANLGIRASSYRAAGGFDAVAEHEDNLLVDRLRERGVIVVSDPIEVLTSGRRIGRTPGGYAAHLAHTLPSDEAGLQGARLDRDVAR